MTVYDRYTDAFIKEKELPDSIELGRFAIVSGNSYNELTGRTYKPTEGQRIIQELLDPVNRDKHEVLQQNDQIQVLSLYPELVVLTQTGLIPVPRILTAELHACLY